ncbi:hypothetical protein [Flammeovirga sp. SJP92]|uniref:hypothetical protein n=1 Tax=Flammeovirga sp. SJP92 TaxID=1775430 RepID=UPI000786B8B8|nr:hypothetical protein [Flammeovirga sp. SJP92]KXX66940.1 hypothetical protein AVL50_29750 [Flammeovirga sp. SJP92]
MIVKCKGFTIGKFKIPPFELNEGELLRIYLCSGGGFLELEKELVKLFTGERNIPELEIHHDLTFVDRIKESKLRSIFFPMTVEKYIKHKGKPDSDISNRIYQIDDFIKPKTKIITLPGNHMKWLSLLTVFSKSNKIIFDLLGQDPLGVEKTLGLVNESIIRGGSAILLDNFDDLETKSDKFIRAEKID